MSMLTREYSFVLTVESEFIQPPFLVKQNDSDSTVFNIQLMKSFSPVNLTGLITKVTVRKPDNTIVFQTPSITDATNGKLSITLTAQTLAVAGLAQAEISVYDNSGNRLTYFEFSLNVSANIDPTNAIESSGDFPAMTELVSHSHWHTNMNTLDAIPTHTGVAANYAPVKQADGSIKWQLVMTNPIDYFTKTESDSRFAPSGYGLGTLSTDKSNADLNALMTTGFYRGSNLTHAPNDNTGYFYVIVEAHSSSWVHQMATSLGNGNTPNLIWSRVLINGTWSAWYRFQTDSGDINAGGSIYLPQGSAVKIGNNIVLTQDSSNNISIGSSSVANKVSIVSSSGTILSVTSSGVLTSKSNTLDDGIGNIVARSFTSNVATGTAPISVSSTTKVISLNADLLDGYHSTDFAPAGFGLGSVAVDISGTNLNTMRNSGFFRGSNLINSPDGSTNWFYVQYMNHDGSYYSLQIAWDYFADKMYFRRYENAVWKPWVRISTSSDAPSGMVNYFATTTVPTGYIKANGALISRTTYSNLFSTIGTTFGSGDGSTTFGVPDLRGEFIRGWDDGRGVDSQNTFGRWQGDDFKAHAHNNVVGLFNHTGGGVNRIAYQANMYNDGGIATDSTGGTETRPRNVSLMACIKY